MMAGEGADVVAPGALPSRAFGIATNEEWSIVPGDGGAGAVGAAGSAAVSSNSQGEDTTARIARLVDDLARHMREAGEIDGSGSVRVPDGGLEDELVFEQRAKLVLMEGVEGAYVVPSSQDWAHDALGDAAVVAGMVYSDGEAFLPGDACIDGYFQADFDGRWVRVVRGRACLAGPAIAWRDSLEEFPELVSELERFAQKRRSA